MAAGIVLAIAGGDASAQTYGFFRYDDDFSAYTDPSVRAQHDPLGLKLIRIDGADGSVLALGADDREKVESYENPAFGLAHAPDQTVWMHRLLVHANLATSQARVFVELGHHTERGRAPTALPTDVDRADVQQAFVDVAVGPNDARITARLGRQEMSYGDGLLIGVRDGPNIRQDWDGARVFWKDATTRVDAFAVRPVGNLRGAFDDADLNGQSLWGLYVTRSSSTRAPALTIDAFYFGSIDRALHLSSGADRDRRSTWGVRLAGAAQGWDGVIEPMVQ